MTKAYRDIVICTPLVEENPVPNRKTSSGGPYRKMFTRIGGMPATFDLLWGMKKNASDPEPSPKLTANGVVQPLRILIWKRDGSTKRANKVMTLPRNEEHVLQ